MLKDGIIQDANINGVDIIVDLIPKTNSFARPRNPMKATSITIHETGNTTSGADAKAHTEYVDNVDSYLSWHFSVDDKCIYQELPIIENAWHAGDGGKGEGNRTSIAIEICVNKDGNFGKAKENAKRLVKYLMKETGINEIYPHKHWSGKYCPMNILNDGWDSFLNWLLSDSNEEKEIEKLRVERDYWKSKVFELYNIAEKATLGGDNIG